MTCQHCTADVTNGLALCDRCQTTLRTALVNTTAYYGDIGGIRPGQRVKVRGAYQSAPPPNPAPKADPVSDALSEADTVITSWARLLLDDRPGIDPPPTTAVRVCAWLEQHVPTIATLDWASEMLRELLALERQLKRVVDKADTGWFAGTCGNVLAPERPHDGFTCDCTCHHDGPCDRDCHPDQPIPAVVCTRALYGSAASSWVRCPECGATYDAEARRETLRRQTEDEVAPIRVIATAVVGLTEETSVQRLTRRIEKWVERGELDDYGLRYINPGDKTPRRVYRIGDVVALVRRANAERAGQEVAQAC